MVIGSWVGTRDKRVHFESTYLGSGASTAMPLVASIFKGVSSWKRPFLTNFEYSTSYFPCPDYSEINAMESTPYYKNDSTYLESLRIKDSLLAHPVLEIAPVLMDSLAVPLPSVEAAKEL
jgi:penicillin-binding protein 1A